MRLGIANSVSKSENFDPIDTIEFLHQHSTFDAVQIYINKKLALNQNKYTILNKNRNLEKYTVILHADCPMESVVHSENDRYLNILSSLENQLKAKSCIFHLDMTSDADVYRKGMEYLMEIFHSPIALELVYNNKSGMKPLRWVDSFLELLQEIRHQVNIIPVIDIPRFYHHRLDLSIQESTNLTMKILDGIHQLTLPIILHLIDVKSTTQSREDFCAIGSGIIPYEQIFHHIHVNQIHIDDIILEFEDKVNPIQSLESIYRYFKK